MMSYIQKVDRLVLPYGDGKFRNVNIYDLDKRVERLNILSSGTINQDLSDALKSDPTGSHAINVKNLVYVDATGFGVLLRGKNYLNKANEDDGDVPNFMFIETHPEVKDLVKLLKLGRIFPSYRDLEHLKDKFPEIPKLE